MTKKKVRKVHVKKVTPPEPPKVELPDEPIEFIDNISVRSGELSPPVDVPAHHRHWYDWIVKTFS